MAKDKRARYFDKITRETRALLVQNFPNCFMAKGQEKTPLKVGIERDIKAALPDLAWSRIRRALRDYTEGPTYFLNAKPGALRVGLDGTQAGMVIDRLAVPELYDALKALQRQALQSELNSPAHEWGQEALTLTAAALAKAEGRTASNPLIGGV